MDWKNLATDALLESLRIGINEARRRGFLDIDLGPIPRGRAAFDEVDKAIDRDLEELKRKESP